MAASGSKMPEIWMSSDKRLSLCSVLAPASEE
jgi:hypothetical protein